MKLSNTLPFVFCAMIALSCAASAQDVSVYGLGGLTAYGTTAGNGNFHSNTFGFTGGGFYNFPINSRMKPAVDARVSYSPGTNGGVAGLVSFRLAFVPHKNPLRPFFQIGGGVISTHYVYAPTAPTRSTGGGAIFELGLDIRLNDHFDLRLPEYGAAAGSTTGFGFLNAGAVYHFGK